MALHWGCLSRRQAALRQVKEREGEGGKEETEKGRESCEEGMGAGDEKSEEGGCEWLRRRLKEGRTK